ncbi:hypothetical protein AUEXF2481DRAFT_39592 [Aureobasidium subglaciale EXF-2481]|uniref:Transcription initiation factor TFIID subunit 1 histone acetyltransferase domain-containing protein n=1 Tax=Aureobasidium subglaciale (strain EXF-2481) TaxID=1043005 RepID=A0A074YDC8_AURSE|nr:uncharacterized protein AUEXF2481DRAFT_39592 [Aureobasidium subglaciale EXF-2481]KEQ95735.1 hypothetical protein AUEXF2481DRAFT_39592 [Aureobasidium subglaciale EXF-2481]
MPHAVDAFELQDQADDAEIARLLNDENPGNNDLNFDRDLEVGEKADDAIDFEDISDDDLAEDEDDVKPKVESSPADGLINQLEPTTEQDENHDDLFGFEDDLFGDDNDDDQDARVGVPQLDDQAQKVDSKPSLPISHGGLALPSKSNLALPGSYTSLALPQMSDDLIEDEQMTDMDIIEEQDDEEDDDWLRQKALFAAMEQERVERSRRGGSYEPPTAPETEMEVFYSIWPSYDPEERPRFTELFPPRRGIYGWKTPVKPPKPVQPTKLSLDLQHDQEKSFRLLGAATMGKQARGGAAEQQGVIRVEDTSAKQKDTEDVVDLDEIDPNERVGGVSWHDLTVLCEDWDMESGASSPGHYSLVDSGVDMGRDSRSPPAAKRKIPGFDLEEPTAKKLKVAGFDLKAAVAISHTYPSLDEPERATAYIAKRVTLDMNDPGLLLDENAPATQPKRLRHNPGDMRRETRTAMARDMTKRYNISNDEAYELLKENHQHKVRSTLGSMAVEHSLPATKLQFPFYRVSLDDKQKRAFHRPLFTGERPNKTITFSKPKRLKRKEMRGKDVSALFAKSEDLSMADNSSALLLEYSEEHPVMLSNFGMGNRLINYYRRKDAEDSSRPKEEIGETQVLLPQDRSPFANFGQVDPGEIVPTIHNGLYRAPVFRHEGKSNDFLVICNETHKNGKKYFMRNIENLYAVGQQFPSVEVPGEHSRKVTDAAKRRLRAISYRVYKKSADPAIRGRPLTNEVVKAHLPGSDVAQNRGKMREFMQYDKNNQLWHLKAGDSVPDSETLRGWIKPEDICVLDSMQVGVQYLKDLGLKKEDDDNEEDDAKEGTNVELKLAPWNTTKNFLNACQGKAMLQLHGEGDPSGRGEAFSFVKTSMKGGFRAQGESIEERLDAKRLKENGGHSYNVAKQQRAYDESIRRIWRSQHESLSSRMENSEGEADVDDEPEAGQSFRAGTPRSSIGTSAYGNNRRDDESASQFSRNSMSQNNNFMVIKRTVRDKYGHSEEQTETITNPRVIAAYKKRKLLARSQAIDIMNTKATGDQDFDALQKQLMQAEIERLERNMGRRQARERAKGIGSAASPSAAASPGGDGADGGEAATPAPTGKGKGRSKKNTEGTARKCANCGQVGHIKTNKKLCPMLNGTMKQEDMAVTGFGGGPGPGAAGAGPGGGTSSFGAMPA